MSGSKTGTRTAIAAAKKLAEVVFGLVILAAGMGAQEQTWHDLKYQPSESWRRYDKIRVVILERGTIGCRDLGIVPPRSFVPADPLQRGHDMDHQHARFEAVHMDADTLLVTQLGHEAFACGKKPKPKRPAATKTPTPAAKASKP